MYKAGLTEYRNLWTAVLPLSFGPLFGPYFVILRFRLQLRNSVRGQHLPFHNVVWKQNWRVYLVIAGSLMTILDILPKLSVLSLLKEEQICYTA